jgi:hypothetical protein
VWRLDKIFPCESYEATEREPSLKLDSKVWARVLWVLDLRVTALARPSINCTDKFQSRPLVREGVLQEESRKCLTIFLMEVKENGLGVPDGGLIPGQTGRLTVGRMLTLN